MKGARLQRLRGRLLSWLILLRDSPGYLAFLPLIARQVLGGSQAFTAPGDVPGGLTAAERNWLAAQARRTPPDGVIVQSGMPEADATCALAAGCWASRRHVYALWPQPEASGAAFREWHRAVIREGLGPYVRPVIEAAEAPQAADLLYRGSAGAWTGRLKPGVVLVQRAASGAAVQGLAPFDACEGLVALRAAGGR